MPWHLLWPPDVLPGTTFGGPLALLGSVVGCWGACCQELALGLLLSTAKEHELSVVLTLMVIPPPSMSNITSQTVVFYYPVECVIVVIISSSYIKALDLWYRNILSNQLVWWSPLLPWYRILMHNLNSSGTNTSACIAFLWHYSIVLYYVCASTAGTGTVTVFFVCFTSELNYAKFYHQGFWVESKSVMQHCCEDSVTHIRNTSQWKLCVQQCGPSSCC